jgi:hypothetical protein
MTARRPAFAIREVGIVLAVQAGLLLAMSPFYGPHRDELYFASAGERLAWGYPDQPSFTPALARLAAEAAPHSLVVLRLPALLAVAALVVLAVQFSRLLDGELVAQALVDERPRLWVAAGLVAGIGPSSGTASARRARGRRAGPRCRTTTPETCSSGVSGRRLSCGRDT